MYGKTLEDFPERFNAFASALADMTEAEINAGFEWALRHATDFPLPVTIRQCAEAATRSNQAKLAEEGLRNQRLIEDRIKDSRFEETSADQRRQEFADMLAEAARRKAMPEAEKEKQEPEAPAPVIPPNIAAAKGPEWEARLRQQAADMLRQAEATVEKL